jgi:uncharacterized protein YutE (UPF0331/DUF86 family)
MDWMKLVASMIENLAWPTTVLVIFFIVRDRVGQLIEKLGKLKYKDLELDFSKIKQPTSIIKAVENAPKEEKSIAIKNPEFEQVFDALEEQIFEAVENAPAAAVLLAWSYVETSLSSAISRLKSDKKIMSTSPLQNIQNLERAGKLSPQQLELLHEMRTLRNKLAHEISGELIIHSDQALDYAKTSVELARFLDGLDRKRKIFMLPRGEWVTRPNGFSEIKDRSGNFWKYSCIDIPGTGLTAGVGTWTQLGDEEAQYYGIDLEQQRKDGCSVVAELHFDLNYVSKDKLNSSARHIVSFDEATRTVSFDLGNAVFEYQLK